jgi:hypothetical protein
MLLAQGIDIKRAVLAFWTGYAAAELHPLWLRLREIILTAGKIAVDETTAPVLDPGRGRTKKGFFWAIARDDRPWGGTDPPAVAYTYAPGRGAVHALKLLDGYRGIVQCDGYAAYKTIANAAPDAAITLAFCWAHYLEHSFMWSSCGEFEFRCRNRMLPACRTPHNPRRRVDDHRRVRGRHCKSRCERCRASRRTLPTRNGVMPACHAVPCIRRAVAPLLATAAMRG